MNIEELLEEIRDAAYEVRLHLSPGYLESVYQNALVIELRKRGLTAFPEFEIPVAYKGMNVGVFKADILVNNAVIIELKAVRELNVLHESQLVNYLTSTNIDYGFLINYGGEKFRIIKKTRIYKA